MKEVLITGSEGFVGRHLRREFEEYGYDVSGTTLKDEDGLPENTFQCNILDVASLERIIGERKPEVIFHLAGQPKPGLSFEAPAMTFEINTIGTVNLLEAVKSIKNYHPRILLVGSSEEHGAVAEKNLPITEETPLNPLNPYAISKVATWYLAQEYHRTFGFDIIYITPFNHTGPGQAIGFLAPDVASQIAYLEKKGGEPVIVTGDLSSKRDISDVRDVVRAYRLLTEKGASGERYIVSSGKSILVSEIVMKLISLSAMPLKHGIDPRRSRPSEFKDLYGSHEKLTAATGWEPEIELEQTLLDLLNWYREQV